MSKNIEERMRALEVQMGKLNQTRYRYYNANKFAKRTDDCVIRAISAGEGKPWDVILQELTDMAKETGYIVGDERLHSKYLKEHGWIKQKQPIINNRKKMTIKEFLDSGFKGKAIINAGNCHVSYLEEGYCYDIYDCTDKIIGCYWTK